MANVRRRPETGCLFLDFRYRSVRCREQTTLQDTPANRRTLETFANRIKREMAKGTFDYRAFFPDSPRASQFDGDMQATPTAVATRSHASPDRGPSTPTLGQFAGTWYQENLPRWRQTHADTVEGTLHQHILPKLGEKPLAEITRADLLAFRAELASRPAKVVAPCLRRGSITS